MTAPFILAIWWKKLNSAGGFAGIGAGFATFAALELMYPEIPGSFGGFWASLIVAVVVSLLTQKSSPPKVLSNADGEAMDLADRLGTLPLFRAAGKPDGQ
jgi:Na+/proline symporter